MYQLHPSAVVCAKLKGAVDQVDGIYGASQKLRKYTCSAQARACARNNLRNS